jgi:hypothetical protein
MHIQIRCRCGGVRLSRSISTIFLILHPPAGWRDILFPYLLIWKFILVGVSKSFYSSPFGLFVCIFIDFLLQQWPRSKHSFGYHSMFHYGPFRDSFGPFSVCGPFNCRFGSYFNIAGSPPYECFLCTLYLLFSVMLQWDRAYNSRLVDMLTAKAYSYSWHGVWVRWQEYVKGGCIVYLTAGVGWGKVVTRRIYRP